MKYAKPALTFSQQADLLISRGMTGDRQTIINRLEAVSYYRLSGYWYPFRQSNPTDANGPLDTFKPDTHFERVWNRYVFDRRLRLLVLDAIERIEIAVRTQLAYRHAQDHGPFAYANDPGSFPGLTGPQWIDFCAAIRRETGRSKETFIRHISKKYGDSHNCFPVWIAVETATFGSVLTFFRGTSHKIKREIADRFGMPAKVFESWLLSLNTVRNICAHHGRLWNREIGTAPMIPRKKDYPTWHQPQAIDNNRVFAVLTICKWSLDRVAPQAHWADRLKDLLTEFPAIPIESMGFFPEWQRSPIWMS